MSMKLLVERDESGCREVAIEEALRRKRQ